MFSFRGGTAITLIGCVVSEFAALNYAGNELTLQVNLYLLLSFPFNNPSEIFTHFFQ